MKFLELYGVLNTIENVELVDNYLNMESVMACTTAALFHSMCEYEYNPVHDECEVMYVLDDAGLLKTPIMINTCDMQFEDLETLSNQVMQLKEYHLIDVIEDEECVIVSEEVPA